MNTTIQRETLIQQLNWRYATKQFDPQRKISPQDWATLEEALVSEGVFLPDLSACGDAQTGGTFLPQRLWTANVGSAREKANSYQY